jgi:hypothetical protein
MPPSPGANAGIALSSIATISLLALIICILVRRGARFSVPTIGGGGLKNIKKDFNRLGRSGRYDRTTWHEPVLQDGPVNYGSMQVKCIRIVRDDVDDVGVAEHGGGVVRDR